jgi:cysteine desulfurase
MERRSVYMDYLAGCPLLPEAADAMRPWLGERWGNASALHQHGVRARDALRKSREQFAELIQARSPDGVIFTSGGTEATNLAVKGAAFAERDRGRHIVLTSIEHPAVQGSVQYLETRGFTSTHVSTDALGRVDPDAIAAALTDETVLVCVQLASPDLGAIQPIPEIAARLRDHPARFFVDASTAGGWTPVDVEGWGVDLLSLAPHRFYGPQGVGVLYRHRHTRLEPILHGGVQEEQRRPGVENIAGIVGAGAAAERAFIDLQTRANHVGKLQRRLLDALRAEIPFLQLNGPKPGDERLPNHLNLSFEFVEGEGVALMADVRGVSFTAGAACTAKALDTPPALEAVGVPQSLADGSVILSPGFETTEDDLDYVVETLTHVVQKLRGMSPEWDEFQAGRLKSILSKRPTE